MKCFKIEDKKEIPMELVPKVDDYGNEKMVCPRCGNTVWSGLSIAKKSPYCSNCGQKIDWKEDK